MVETRASDLHLKVPRPPMLRIDGVLVPQEDFPSLTPKDIDLLVEQCTSQAQREAFSRELELDFSYSVRGLARFRVNLMQQRGSKALAFRVIPFKIPAIEELGLPPICKELILRPRGLILVTGHTGSGKSTTLAAMIDYLNETKAQNVITIEDPVEFLHTDKKCIISQRDLSDDTKSFANALVHALRHDPDVIVVGEMRDLETISTAMMAAETGHLVLGTLHTTDAAQTADRIIDIFPPAQQQQVRLQFSQVLVAILSQALLARSGGKGRVAAVEILLATPAVRNLIREEKLYELPGIMQINSKEGMQTLDQALADLVKKNVVTLEEAMSKSSNPKQLSKWLQYVKGAAAPFP